MPGREWGGLESCRRSGLAWHGMDYALTARLAGDGFLAWQGTKKAELNFDFDSDASRVRPGMR